MLLRKVTKTDFSREKVTAGSKQRGSLIPIVYTLRSAPFALTAGVINAIGTAGSPSLLPSPLKRLDCLVDHFHDFQQNFSAFSKGREPLIWSLFISWQMIQNHFLRVEINHFGGCGPIWPMTYGSTSYGETLRSFFLFPPRKASTVAPTPILKAPSALSIAASKLKKLMKWSQLNHRFRNNLEWTKKKVQVFKAELDS